MTTLAATFPAEKIMDAEIFPSLLFYYGMLTITATRGNYLVLSIPNNNVRKQYYEYMLEEYQSANKKYLNLNDLGLLYYDMAFDGRWHESLEFIAHAYKDNSSVRSLIEGERNIQGFFTAYLSINAYYLTAPEIHRYAAAPRVQQLIRSTQLHCIVIQFSGWELARMEEV